MIGAVSWARKITRCIYLDSLPSLRRIRVTPSPSYSPNGGTSGCGANRRPQSSEWRQSMPVTQQAKMCDASLFNYRCSSIEGKEVERERIGRLLRDKRRKNRKELARYSFYISAVFFFLKKNRTGWARLLFFLGVSFFGGHRSKRMKDAPARRSLIRPPRGASAPSSCVPPYLGNKKRFSFLRRCERVIQKKLNEPQCLPVYLLRPAVPIPLLPRHHHKSSVFSFKATMVYIDNC